MGAVSRLSHFEMTLHIQTQVRDLGLRYNVQWIQNQYFNSLQYNYNNKLNENLPQTLALCGVQPEDAGGFLMKLFSREIATHWT